MKLCSFWLRTLALVAAVSAFTGLGASANISPDDAASVSISLDTPTTVTLGEPIILHCKVTNLAPDQKLGVLLGAYGNAWYTLTLTDQTGKSAPPVPDLRPAEPRGLFIPGNIFLGQQGSDRDQRESYVVVNQAFSLTHSGRYALTAHVHLPYATAPLSAIGLSDGAVKDSGTVLTQEFVFPITVTPADPGHLRQVSESLRQSIGTERNDAKYKALLAALFTMPEAQAFASWEALASHADWTNREVLAEQFAKVHSVKTVDLLVKMLDDSALSSDEASFVRTKIDESYNAGEATVKGHIKALAASRGGSMPEKVSIPQPSD